MKPSDLPFPRKCDRKKEKSVDSFTHEQSIICTKLEDIAHEQTIICRQLFAGRVVGCRPIKMKKTSQRTIIIIDCNSSAILLGLCSKVLSTKHCGGRGRDYSIDLSHFLFNMFWFKLGIFIVWSSECGK